MAGRPCCRSLGAGLNHKLKLNLEGRPGGYSVEDEAVHLSAIEWPTNPVNEFSHAFGVAFYALDHPEELGVGVLEARAFGEQTAGESDPIDRGVRKRLTTRMWTSQSSRRHRAMGRLSAGNLRQRLRTGISGRGCSRCANRLRRGSNAALKWANKATACGKALLCLGLSCSVIAFQSAGVIFTSSAQKRESRSVSVVHSRAIAYSRSAAWQS